MYAVVIMTTDVLFLGHKIFVSYLPINKNNEESHIYYVYPDIRHDNYGRLLESDKQLLMTRQIYNLTVHHHTTTSQQVTK